MSDPYSRLLLFTLKISYLTGFIVGNMIISLIEAESVKNIISLSIPIPNPPVGGIPVSKALMNSSSIM